ncbi:transcriptional regulator, GntR family [Rhodococcoides kroppenstedtii]|uniref:Transcriptional regulator, GntR family n=2 Tax=Rhodococcoides kroppenstedtii TaxID=293050 RepID=A0A1I0TZ57_9NOCA|nr:HTH-type transcriptional repressor RspR [Rhodococcus kroppenstedtii]SFA57065.1 transcriptional regulator, GntR family [Rhodococcus kroppenstedtii]
MLGYTYCMHELSGRERAYAYLRDQVLSSPAATGTFLNEGELASQIGVSRTPVREALLLLVSEGLIEMVRGRGAYVPPMSGRQIGELMDLRGVLERHAADLCLTAGSVPVERMSDTLDQQEALSEGAAEDHARTFIALDGAFHQHLIDAAGSELLSHTYAGLRARQLRAGLSALFGAPDRKHQVCTEHRAIVDALRAGDGAAVAEAIDAHLTVTTRILLRG